MLIMLFVLDTTMLMIGITVTIMMMFITMCQMGSYMPSSDDYFHFRKMDGVKQRAHNGRRQSPHNYTANNKHFNVALVFLLVSV